MKDIFILNTSVDVGRGGLTRVMLERASFLSRENFNSNIVTFDYKDNYKQIHQKLIDSKRLDSKVSILNVYDYYKNKNMFRKRISKDDKQIQKMKEKNLRMHLETFRDYKHIRYFDNEGRYVLYKRWNNEGNLLFVERYRDDRSKLCRFEFNGKKEKTKTIYYDMENRKKQELYHTPDGFTFLNVDYNAATEKPIQIFLFDRKENEIIQFGTKNPMLQFHKHWLEELSKSCKEKPLIINDGIFLTHTLMEVDKKLAYRVCAVHTNHFDSPFTYGSVLRKSHEHLMKNYKKLDGIVFLTKKQRDMVIEQFGDYQNDFIIPNALSNIQTTNHKKDFNKLCYIGRLDENKNVSESIKAFNLIKNNHPDAQFHIYGSGSEKNNLLSLINQLELSEQVFIHDYTNEVGRIFEESLFSVVTSNFEGFCLVITESMMMGTPVISYDCNFGPSDIISDGEDGFLVESGNVSLFAEKMSHYLSNPEIALKMGEKAKINVNKFEQNQVYGLWLKLIAVLEKNSK